MIRVSDERALEKLLKNTRFTNEVHKENLMRRLLEEASVDDELSEDDLEMAAGGTRPPEADLPRESI